MRNGQGRDWERSQDDTAGFLGHTGALWRCYAMFSNNFQTCFGPFVILPHHKRVHLNVCRINIGCLLRRDLCFWDLCFRHWASQKKRVENSTRFVTLIVNWLTLKWIGSVRTCLQPKSKLNVFSIFCKNPKFEKYLSQFYDFVKSEIRRSFSSYYFYQHFPAL